MEDWSKGFFEAIDTAVLEMEKFVTEVGDEVQQVVDEWTRLSEEFAREINNKVIPEVDEFVNEVLEPILDIYFDIELDLMDDDFESFVSYAHPTASKNPACRGCQHYHGHVYNNNLLVCAMHPSGVEDETCPDWESV
jgi:hypothetical protein